MYTVIFHAVQGFVRLTAVCWEEPCCTEFLQEKSGYVNVDACVPLVTYSEYWYVIGR